MPSPLNLHLCAHPTRAIDLASRDGRRENFPCKLLCACVLLCSICTSCGLVSSSSPPPPATISVTPNSAQPFPGGVVPFQAVVENASSPAVSWQVNGTIGGNSTVGTIDSSGRYTAPSTVPNPATVMVMAALQSDPTKTGSASVTVQSFSAYTGPLVVSPALTSITPSQTVQFNILTAGIGNTEVSWAATGGTIASNGLYMPPSAPGAYTIIASLPHATASATVEVTNFPGTLTWRNDNARSGVNSQELALAPGTVNPSKFGKLFSCPIDGYAYAQPLYVPNLSIPGKGTHNVIFVATEMDSVFAFDADAQPCVQLWKTSLIPAGSQAIATPNLTITSTDIVPFVGITGTPVISLSPSTPYLYVVAAIETNPAAPSFSQLLYALDLATGQIQLKPAGILSSPGQAYPYLPTFENQRPALLLDNGIVYVAFGSFGEVGEYHGWLFGFDAASLQPTGSFDVTPGGQHGGIWQSGGGPSVDSNHNVYVATGDGTFNASRPEVNYNYGDSFLRLQPGPASAVSDYFTPCDEGSGHLVGTGAPVLLPDSAGSPSQPHLLIGASKGISGGGSLYVVNRDNMGGLAGPCPDSTARVQTVPVAGGPILSTPLFWNNAVYVVPGSGNLQSFQMSGGILSATPSASQSPEMLGPQGATPVISSNGTSNAVLWLIDSSGALATQNSPAILRAYDPNNLKNEIYNSAMAAASRDTAGLAVKFTVPTVANGKVYVGTQTELDVYGLLP